MPHTPACDQPIPRSTLSGTQSAIFLLTIEIAGQVLRYSTRAVDVTSSAEGKTYRFRGALPALEVEQALDVLSQTPQAPSVSMDLIIEEPIAEWVKMGHRLDQAVGELSWWVPGTTWEKRQVLVKGSLRSATYGSIGEPCGFVLEPQLKGEGALILQARHRVSEDTAGSDWVENEEGAYYPLVFGSPGYRAPRLITALGVPATVQQKTAGSPALKWQSDASGVSQLMVCSGHATKAGDVTVAFDQTPNGESGTVDVGGEKINFDVDEDGQPITTLNIVADLTVDQRNADRFGISWREAAGGTSLSGNPERRYRYTLRATDGTGVYPIAPLRVGDVARRRIAEVTTAFDGTPTIRITQSENTGFVGIDVPSLDLTTPGVYTSSNTVQFDVNGSVVADYTAAGATTGVCKIDTFVQDNASGLARLDTLGKLLTWIIDRLSVRVARESWYSLANDLHLPVAGYINDPSVSYWQYMTESVLPLLPVSLRHGPDGVYPVYWRWRAGPEDAIAHLAAGVNGVVRLPDVRSARPDAEVNTEGLFRFAWDPIDESYRDEVRAKSNGRLQLPAWRQLRGDSMSGNIELAAQTYGTGRVLTMESKIVYERRTADWVLAHRLAAEGWAHRVLEIECDQTHGFLVPGNVVTFTDPTVSLSRAVALVQARRVTDTGRIGFTLLFVEGYRATTTGPVRDPGPVDRPGIPTPGQ